jgi:hypothetical protein
MATFDHLAALVLDHLDREYPHKTGLIWADASEVVAPSVSSPVFGGSFDWHSSVHSHWTLVTLAGLGVDGIEAVLDRRFTAEAFAVERGAIDRPHRLGFEMPYGIAWLLALAGAMARVKRRWYEAIEPLAELALDRYTDWLVALAAPIRTGEHSQTAWSMTLALEAAADLGLGALTSIVRRRAVDFYGGDVDAPFAYEPSAYDFLSPALAEAELMAEVLAIPDFAPWWRRFAPGFDGSLAPVVTTDRADGKLAHWDGLNLSRAWMLSAIGAALGDDRLAKSAAAHRDAGMAGLEAATYAGAHWLATFALRAELKAAAEST